MTNRQSLALLVEEVKGVNTKTDIAYEVLRKAILDGLFPPGAPLGAKSIATELGMSLIPLREAFRKLEQDGLISITPHMGAAVRMIAEEELLENLLIRSNLEALSAGLSVPYMTPKRLRTLRILVQRMDECIAINSADDYRTLDRKFHLMIYKANPYQRLYQLIESLWDQRLKHAHSIFALFPNYMVKSQGAHYQLLEALQKHDAEGTEKIMRQHKENVRQALIQYFEVSKRGQNHEPPTNEETASAA